MYRPSLEPQDGRHRRPATRARAARRRISAIAGPGEAEMSSTATTKAGISAIRSTGTSSHRGHPVFFSSVGCSG